MSDLLGTTFSGVVSLMFNYSRDMSFDAVKGFWLFANCWRQNPTDLELAWLSRNLPKGVYSYFSSHQ